MLQEVERRQGLIWSFIDNFNLIRPTLLTHSLDMVATFESSLEQADVLFYS